jgi:hypothetical protein
MLFHVCILFILCPFTFLHSLYPLKYLLCLWKLKWLCLICRSALRAFKRRVVYANVINDRILHIYICYIFLLLNYKYIQLSYFVYYYFNLVFLIKTLDVVGWGTASIRVDSIRRQVCLLTFFNAVWLIYWITLNIF